ncbi:MAG TPA: ribonuclease HII [Pyrinomonadaceae bacterium]|nr:ribonuclease HII [Pyrinomonadaceae bacterium]
MKGNSAGADSSLRPSPSAPRRRRRVSTICTDFEDAARAGGFRLIAGVDEVGRGALAGPVVAGAVILDPERPIPEGLDDSKKLTALQRRRITEEILSTAVAYAVGQVEPEEIDRLNILQASRLAMMEALKQLAPQADYLLIDAVQLKETELPQKAIIHGDSISASIAAASVIAKTYRDALMHGFHEVYPQYNFAKHVGYCTREHLQALREHGPCRIHRQSFHPVLTCKDVEDEKQA